MGKYDAWRPFFRDLKPGSHRVPLEQLSELLDGGLPPVARSQTAWWSNVAYASSSWTECGWYAHPKLRDGLILFDQESPSRGRPPSSPGEDRRESEPQSTQHDSKADPGPRPEYLDPPRPSEPRLLLVGCVSQKRTEAAPARDLYTSDLWQKRRAYAESTGIPWAILSAEYRLVMPDDIIEPYDRSLKDAPVQYRRSWSKEVAESVIEFCRQHVLTTVEVHAGSAYLENGLIRALNQAGIRVVWPLRGLKIGEQLAWYNQALTRSDEKATKPVASNAPPQTPTGLPTIVSLHRIDSFDFNWPDAVESFDYGWEGEADDGGRRIRFRHGVGGREVYGQHRTHTVTWINGQPVVEGVAADDYLRSRSLLSLLKTPGGSMVRAQSEIPNGYEAHLIVDHRSEIDAPYSRAGLAVKIRVDDVSSWVQHALLRQISRPSDNTREAGRAEPRQPLEPTSPIPPMPPEAKAAVAARLAEFAPQAAEGLDAQDPAGFTGDPDANRLLFENPLAFLLAVIADYQIPAERAWSVPYRIRERLGHLDPIRLLAEPDRLYEAFAERPALHRYVNRVPDFILAACEQVLTRYGGDAGRIWADNPRAIDVQERLTRFDGISQKKAAMAVEILERDMGIPIRDMDGSDIAFDIHIRRVFLRSGIAEHDDQDHMIEMARELWPERPGLLDLPSWVIGRTWCRPREPQCSACVLDPVCAHRIESGNEVRGA